MVHIVDNDDHFRTSLISALGASGLRAIGYRCAAEFLLAEQTDAPGCVLLDVATPSPNGIELLDELSTRECAPKVIVVSACRDVATSVRAMRSGALDFLIKPIGTDRLLERVHKALDRDRQQRAAREQIRVLRQRYHQLNDRERAVLLGVINGKLNKQLAVELDICERSIKAYRASMQRKLQATSLADLIRTAWLLGLTDSQPSRAAAAR